ncbi:MAG TPA: amidophosphoribosyltransferase, partial [Brevundimonas sp.]|nr:amidophosphoribosyltransferase [Brevundimonas sp.]
MRHHIADPIVHREHWREPEDDQLRLECGVCGVWGAPENEASSIVALGLHALQHRGQEACGIASVHDDRFYTERHQGLVGEAFGNAELTTRLPGGAAVGHTRYSTAGGSFLRNIQPMFADLDQGGIAIAHNGNLTNFKYLHGQLVSEGAIFQSTSDSEAILHLIARSRKAKIVERFIDALGRIEGGYALVAQTRLKLIGARDPLGIRPLVLGKIGEAWVLASETCALDTIGATFIRDVEHGEVVVIDEDGLTSIKPFPARAA